MIVNNLKTLHISELVHLRQLLSQQGSFQNGQPVVVGGRSERGGVFQQRSQ